MNEIAAQNMALHFLSNVVTSHQLWLNEHGKLYGIYREISYCAILNLYS